MKIRSINYSNYFKMNSPKKSFKGDDKLTLQDELIAKPITPEQVSKTNTRLSRNDSSKVTVDFEEGAFKKAADMVLGIKRRAR